MKEKAERFLYRHLIPEQKLREAMELFPGKTRDEVGGQLRQGLKKKLMPVALLTPMLLVLAVIVGGNTGKETGIKRPEPGSVPVTQQVQLETGEGWETLDVIISAREYEEGQIEEMHRVAEEYLQEAIVGQNESLQRVTRDLYFPETLPSYGCEISWKTDAPWYVASDGTVQNEELNAVETVELRAEIKYGSECRYFVRQIQVYPREYTYQELLLREAGEALQQQEASSRTAERFNLPESVLGYPLKQKENSSFGAEGFFVLTAIAVPVFLYSGYFSDIEEKRKKRKEQAESCYTEFITKLSLLMAAGISVRQAFCRLAGEYGKQQGPEHVLTQELTVTKQELENGYSETVVYENFGRRLGVLPYQRMASLLTQNVSRGVQGMQILLLQEAKDVMAQDRANIKVKGEQAGTKLLLPMMGLLLLVFAILLVPAFRSF